MAGLPSQVLWDEWRGPEGSVLSCTIVVGRPNGLVAEIHDRMVLILPEDAYATCASAPVAPIDGQRAELADIKSQYTKTRAPDRRGGGP